MTLVSELLTEAFRDSNRIAAGATEPTALAAEGLTLFNRIVATMMSYEVGENLKQWPVGTAGYAVVPDDVQQAIWQYPPINSMLVCNLASAQTLYLPSSPSDGARLGVQDLQGNFATYNLILNGNGRQVEGAATLTLSTDSLNRSWFFRADTGTWTRFTTLIAADTFPFPTEFEDLFILMLMVRLSPRMGPEPSKAALAVLKDLHARFTARYVQSQDLAFNPDLAPVYMSQQGYDRGFASNTELAPGN